MSNTDPSSPLNKRSWADLAKRAVTALVLAPVIIFVLWLGGVWFEMLLVILGLALVYEWFELTHRAVSAASLSACILAIAIAAFAPHWPTAYVWLFLAILWGLDILLSRMIVAPQAASQSRKAQFWRIISLGYLAIPIACLSFLRSDPHYGFTGTLWIFIFIWSVDTFAYFFGRLIGGPKLAPKISPKKTWAGLVGAVFGGVLASFAVAWLALGSWSYIFLGLAVILAVIAQAGDFFESAAKRYFDVKDSGILVPGHGGVLDRLDGLLPVAVVVFIIGALRQGPDAVAAGILTW